MATGRSMQLTKQVGEYLVAAQLCRMGLISTTFTGNTPQFDILATDESLRTVPVQVKTTRSTSWQFDARKFLDIPLRGDVQTIEGKKRLANPNLIFAMVKLKGKGKDKDEDKFYICRITDIQRIVFDRYRDMLQRKGGRRPKKPESTHCAVAPGHLSEYENNWRLITQALRPA